MSHLWSGSRCSIFVLNHTVMELRRHGNNHVIIVWVEMSSLWYIKTEWWVVVISGQQVIWIVDKSRIMGSSLGKLWRPNTKVCILGLMDSHVWWPHSIMNNSLSKVPLLEEITSVLLMTGMNLWQINHFLSQFSLFETLVHEQIIFLMHSSVTSLA